MYAPSTFSGRFAEKPIEFTPSRSPGVARVSPSMGMPQLYATPVVSALKVDGSTAIGIPPELLIEAVRGKLTNFSPVEAPAPDARRRPLAMAAAMAPSRRVVRRLLICRQPYA